jgi:hypothetical protein
MLTTVCRKVSEVSRKKLDHYYKMAQTKEQIQKRERDMLDEQNEMRERAKKGILLFFTTISSSY